MKTDEYMDNAATNPAGNAIVVNKLTLEYGTQVLFRGFSLTVPAGQKVLLVGSSGSGKSSLVRCLLGFVIPQEGTITIDGTILDGKTVWSLRRKIGYVSQEPQLGAVKVKDLIQLPFTYHANAHLKYDPSGQARLFEQFCLGGALLDKNISELSGGEKQRVALVISLLLGRSIYLLDEATSALDAKAKTAVLDYFRQRPDLTVLMVSHDTAIAAIADRTVTISAVAAQEAG
jgi:putative ABC transport system ATP-binding protein